jgi:hypothetical protein
MARLVRGAAGLIRERRRVRPPPRPTHNRSRRNAVLLPTAAAANHSTFEEIQDELHGAARFTGVKWSGSHVTLPLLSAAVVADDIKAVSTLVQEYKFSDRTNVASAACVAAGTGREKCLELLLQFLPPAEDAHHDLACAVWWAAGNGHVGCLRILWEGACKMDARDCNGLDAVFMAAQNGHDQALRFLADEAHCPLDRKVKMRTGPQVRTIPSSFSSSLFALN